MSTYFEHRDGLIVWNVRAIETEIAWKINGRGRRGGHRVYVGYKEHTGEDSSRSLVIAIPGDIHHVALSAEQAAELGACLLEYARTDRWPPDEARVQRFLTRTNKIRERASEAFWAEERAKQVERDAELAALHAEREAEAEQQPVSHPVSRGGWI